MQNFMILLKIEDGKLQGNMEEIRQLALAYDHGCASEQAYTAKIIELLWSNGYEQGIEDVVNQQHQIAITMMHTEGHA